MNDQTVTKADIDNIVSLIQQLSERIDQRFEAVEQRLDRLENRMTALEFQMVGINRNLDQSGRLCRLFPPRRARSSASSTNW